MSSTAKTHTELFEIQSLPKFAENAYLDYAMYVILDRALPHLADGLKPVQRRIVYAMSELGLSAIAKHKKSARTVGDVIGKFHPHGDAACYEAMVLLAQPFSTRYPLVDGQGNFGSVDDPKSFAAMRYTESKLSRYAELLLDELGQGTVDFVPNFDSTLEEPKLFPARLPMLLLNGAMGIAVGMSTDIPPHNLKEVALACIHVLKHPDTTLDALMKILPAPDFPTAAELTTPAADIRKIYETGMGMLKMRAVYHQEDSNIVITALPYQASPTKVIEQIADQMRNKRLPLVTDLRDESDHENPVRIVIEVKSVKLELEPLLSHLFATTDLERNIRVNMNVIGLDGKPKVYSLIAFLKAWLQFRQETVIRKLQYRLEKVLTRLHVLEGFLTAFLNIDEVIAIIRQEDEPKAVLMARFGLSMKQTEAVLELKLKQLARLEEIQIRGEESALNEERQKLVELLGSPEKLKTLLQNDLTEIAKKYGDARRSPLVARSESKALQESETIPVEQITVVLSEKGWIRAAKSHDFDINNLTYKSSDAFLQAQKGRTNQTLFLLDSTGRSYTQSAFGLPSARGFGEPLTSQLKPPSGAEFVGFVLTDHPAKAPTFVLLATKGGYGFRADLEQLYSKNKAGKTMISVGENVGVLKPLLCAEDDGYVALLTGQSRILIIPISELPLLPKGKGNKLIELSHPKGVDVLIDWIVIPNDKTPLVLVGAKKDIIEPKAWKSWVGHRAQKGEVISRKKPDRLEIGGL